MPRHGAFGLVMPVAGRGNVIQYLLANPDADRTEIVLQAAEGLRYLHEEAKCMFDCSPIIVNLTRIILKWSTVILGA
jgi:hypothetical protein